MTWVFEKYRIVRQLQLPVYVKRISSNNDSEFLHVSHLKKVLSSKSTLCSMYSYKQLIKLFKSSGDIELNPDLVVQGNNNNDNGLNRLFDIEES